MDSSSSEEKVLLKDILDPSYIKDLANELSLASPLFLKKSFLKQLPSTEWDSLPLKQRVTRLAQAIHESLPVSYPRQIKALTKASDKFTGLKGLVFPEFVSSFGLDHWKTSTQALKVFTEYSTAEYAIRFFIKKDSREMVALAKLWSLDKNHHVRRLASEGFRPRLPWSFYLSEFIKDPSPILDILETLKDDDSLYVRKSVANNLNDISKDHPKLVLKLAEAWMASPTENTKWIVKHALRTLLKNRNPKALKIFGVADAKNIEIKDFAVPKGTFKVGEHLSFSFALNNKSKLTKKIRIEYMIYFLKKNGELSPKVFKLAEKDFVQGLHKLSRRHSLKPMSTRTYYSGVHKVSLVINGQILSETSFRLIK